MLAAHQTIDSQYRTIDSAIRHLEPINLQHLRRLVKPENLPIHLKDYGEGKAITGATSGPPKFSESIESDVVDITSGSIGIPDSHTTQPKKVFQQGTLILLACTTSSISYEGLHELLSATGYFVDGQSQPCIRIAKVPVTPPLSHEQGMQFSQKYWPTVYKGNNPFGPHPAIVTQAAEGMKEQVGHYMSLASQAGMATSDEGKGEPFGAIVVEHLKPGVVSVVAAAGDARWNCIKEARPLGNGNVMAHAVMRVIGMVAKQRVATSITGDPRSSSGEQPDLFADEPLTVFEKQVYSHSKLAGGGYLCLDLELYLTHEPCVMCSMAINHSRFGSVVFGQRMSRTGGLVADRVAGSGSPMFGESPRPGYGLWWNSELNWKFLSWQWIANDPPKPDLSHTDIQV